MLRLPRFLVAAAVAGAIRFPWSQVDGCHAKLDSLRHYHQRYKVCDDHLKMAELVHQGITQRFCQQCSRFHSITEFEGDRRSCKVCKLTRRFK